MGWWERTSGRLWTVVAPAATVLILVAFLRPWAWAGEYPLTGDWVGHLSAFGFAPFHGFTTDWWGGHPLWYFYFPFPFWLGQLAGGGPAVVKTLGMLPVVGLPPAVWWLARCHRRPRGEAALWAFSTAAYLVTPFSHREGGFMLSALVGEFNYSWGLLLSVLCLAAAARGASRAGGLLLAAGMLSHPIPAAVAGLVLVRRWRLWVPAAGLTVWWWLPALGRADWVNSRHQTPLPWPWVSHGGGWWLWALAACGLAGVLVWVRRDRLLGPFAWFGLWPLAYFLWQGTSGVELPLWNGRLRPLFILVMFWAAASAMWWAVGRIPRRREEWATLAGLLLLLFCLFQPGSWRTNTLKAWQLENDLTTMRATWEDMPAILQRLETLPRSIVAVEYIPRLSDNRVGWELPRVGQRSAGGVYYESARSARHWQVAITQLSRQSMIDVWGHAEQYPPTVNMFDPQRGVEKVRALGARWLIGTLDTISEFPPGLITPVWEGTWLGLYDTEATPISRLTGSPPEAVGHQWWEWWNENSLTWVEPASDVPVSITGDRIVFTPPGRGGTWLLSVSCFPGWQITTGGTVDCAPTDQLMVTPAGYGPVELVWETGGLERAGWVATVFGVSIAWWLWTRTPRHATAEGGSRDRSASA